MAKPDKTAILLIEFQKTWTEKGIFHKMIRKEYESGDVLNNTKKLITSARENGIPIIQAPLILDKSDKQRYKKTPFPARLMKRFTKGTWKAEFTEGIYEPNDIVIKGRYGFDACEGSDLEEQLRKNEIKTVLICGFTTDHCVKETMNSLLDKGFKCAMVSDCTAARSHKLQRKIESELEHITSGEAIKNIKEN
jgi:nicotinamidase-related amidase